MYRGEGVCSCGFVEIDRRGMGAEGVKVGLGKVLGLDFLEFCLVR